MRAAGSRATALATLVIMTMPSLLPACVQATPVRKKRCGRHRYRYPRIGCGSGTSLEQALTGDCWHSGRFVQDACSRPGGSPVPVPARPRTDPPVGANEPRNHRHSFCSRRCKRSLSFIYFLECCASQHACIIHKNASVRDRGDRLTARRASHMHTQHALSSCVVTVWSTVHAAHRAVLLPAGATPARVLARLHAPQPSPPFHYTHTLARPQPWLSS